MENPFEEILDDVSTFKTAFDITMILSSPSKNEIENFQEAFDQRFEKSVIKDSYSLFDKIQHIYPYQEHLNYLGSEIISSIELQPEDEDYIMPNSEEDEWYCIRYEMVIKLKCSNVGMFILKTNLDINKFNFSL